MPTLPLPSPTTASAAKEKEADEFAAESLGKAWDLLAGLAPDLYDGGAYTSGNTQSIQLLAQGVVTMTPVWSDQVLQAMSQGVLPETTGLVQLSDVGFPGNDGLNGQLGFRKKLRLDFDALFLELLPGEQRGDIAHVRRRGISEAQPLLRLSFVGTEERAGDDQQ